MSYDFELFRTPPGADPFEVLDELTELMGTDEGDAMPTEDVLVQYRDDFREVLGDKGTCDVECGVVSVHIPYHYEGAAAERIFGRVMGVLRRAVRKDGLTAYDPQTGELVDVDNGVAEILGRNESGTQFVRDIAPKRDSPPLPAPPSRKPWWKFW